MKRSIFLLLVLTVSVISVAAPGTIIKSGKCTLQEAEAFDDSKLWVLDLKNEEIQIVFRVRGSKFFDRFVIMTSPKVTNLCGKPKHASYSLAFFDKNGKLVACTSSNADLKADTKNMQTGASMPGLPRPSLDKITSYQVVVYISEGKKK